MLTWASWYDTAVQLISKQCDTREPDTHGVSRPARMRADRGSRSDGRARNFRGEIREEPAATERCRDPCGAGHRRVRRPRRAARGIAASPVERIPDRPAR